MSGTLSQPDQTFWNILEPLRLTPKPALEPNSKMQPRLTSSGTLPENCTETLRICTDTCLNLCESCTTPERIWKKPSVFAVGGKKDAPPSQGLRTHSVPSPVQRARHVQICTFFPKQLWSWMGFSILPRNRLCSIIISCFRLGFRGLSPYSFGILFHHHFRVLARVPGLVSVLFWHPVPSSFPGSG